MTHSTYFDMVISSSVNMTAQVWCFYAIFISLFCFCLLFRTTITTTTTTTTTTTSTTTTTTTITTTIIIINSYIK